MRLGIGRFLKLLFASFFIQTSWSFLSMQGMGFLYNLFAGAKPSQKETIMRAHKGFFNTHPYMVSYIIGATTRAHDEKKLTHDEINKFIAIAQVSFASAGDLLFWRTIRPALLIIAVILALKVGIFGAVFFIVSYNLFHIYHRVWGIIDGYKLERNVIYLLKSKRFTIVQRMFETLGALATGLLCALVTLKTNYLMLVPITLLFILLILKRFSSVLITLAIILLIVIMVLV